jgi:hypothetical protein
MEQSGHPPPMGDDPREPLRRLEERLSRATEAAERLITEAARGGGNPRRPPPAGWQTPTEERRPMPEVEALITAVGSLRELIPPEISERLVAALRELLLAIRAVLDHYLERLERRQPEPPEVQDIPLQ